MNARAIAPIITAMLVAVCAAAPAEAAKGAKKGGGKLGLKALSSAPDMVTGEDVLIAVSVPRRVKTRKVRVRLNGRNVTSVLGSSPGGKRQLVGLVEGLEQGANLITAHARGMRKPARLALFDTAIQGPLFSGPHQQPFFCRTADNGLGAATDADCSAPSKVDYFYRSNTGDFKPLADPSVLPADGIQTTTRDGRTVDYVVRLESGVIDRSVYRWAILAPGGRTAEGWNERLIYAFGGGCEAGHQQGLSGPTRVLDNRELSAGYAVLSGSLNAFKTACNDVLSAEAAAMLKEHVIESLGREPVWTVGEGGSGGSVQAQLIGQNYPGLLDGLLPSASFPDGAGPDYPDCRLLEAYYATPEGAALSDAQREAVSGLSNPAGCVGLGAGADVVNASEGCDETIVPPAQIFDAMTNPGGIRCTVWDSMVNVYGTDPATGYARRTLDNVGVQYGLKGLQGGAVSLNEFLDLNQEIGGYDDNGELRSQRSVADPEALAVAYRSGRVQQGAGGIAGVPIIDARSYVDDEVNVHQFINGYRMRARLQRFNGTDGNQVMFRAQGGDNVGAMRDAALETMGRWLDAITADDSGRSQAEKVLLNKPTDAVDACWANGGQRTNGPAVIGDPNFCETTYPPHSLPVNQAGRPLDSVVLKCRLRPINFADYGSPNPLQRARLGAIFSDGVCDWSQPGVGEEPLAGTWQEFGPQRVSRARKSRLKLKARVRGSGRKSRVSLDAKLKPCPRVGFQRVVFERRRKGKWRKVGSAVTGGKRCRARERIRVRGGSLQLRARFDRVDGFKGAKSERVRVRVRRGSLKPLK